MKRLALLFCLVFCIGNTLLAQDCTHNDSIASYNAGNLNKYDDCVNPYNVFPDYLSYIPGYGPNGDEMIYVKLTFAILQDANGNSAYSGNYQQDFDALVASVNGGENAILQNLSTNITNPDPIFVNGNPLVVTDAKIRLVVDTIFYFKNTLGLDLSDPDNRFALIYDTYVPDRFKRKSSVVVLSSGSLTGTGLTPGGNALAQYVFMDNYGYWFGGTLIHELGHDWGLQHTFPKRDDQWGDGDGIADTPDDIYAKGASVCAPLPADCGCPPTTPYPNNICPANVMGYNDRTYFSPSQIGRMRKNLATVQMHQTTLTNNNSIVIGLNFANLPYTVRNDETWTVPRIHSNIVVESGATLTIKTECRMTDNATIMVEPGAHLVLECANLERLDANFWGGIRLLGDNTVPQTASLQGKLTAIDSRISGASDAIENAVWVNGYPIVSGGIIHVESTSFVDNLRDVVLLKYDYKGGSRFNLFSPDYDASFHDCVFEKDRQTLNPWNLSRGASFVLWGVNNVNISNCAFDRTLNAIGSLKTPELGLFMLDASVNLSKSSFRGHTLEMQINDTRSFGLGSLISENSFLVLKGGGLYIEGGNDHFIRKNTFSINLEQPELVNDALSLYTVPYGIYLNGTSGFTVVENGFAVRSVSVPGAPANAANMGLIVNDNGGFGDIIYKNRFSSLSFATEALGHNRTAGGLVGLQFRCNEFVNNKSDIYVGLNQNAQINPALMGIRRNQGDPEPTNLLQTPSSDLAGNLFSNTSGLVSNYNNGSLNSVNYYHHTSSGSLKTAPTLNQNVNTFDAQKSWVESVACPTPLIVQPEGDTLNELDYPLSVAEADFIEGGAKSDSLEALIAQLVDGGNSLQLQIEIMFTQEHEHYELYQQLLSESPYLSLGTLEELIYLESFPDLMLRNIFIANPQGGKEQHLIDLIIEYHPTMSQAMLDDIQSGNDSFGALELMQTSLSKQKTKQFRAADRLLYLYKTDENSTDNPYLASKTLLQQIDEPQYQYKLVDLEYSVGNLDEGNTLMFAIGTNDGLDEVQQAIHAGYEEWYTFKNALEGGNFLNASDEQINNLLVTSNGIGKGASAARAVLNFLEVTSNYVEPMVIPQLVNGKKTQETLRAANSLNYANQIYPNPASDYFVVEMDPQLSVKGVTLEVLVMDLSGKVISKKPLEEEAQFVSTQGLLNGVYLVKVLAGETVLMTDKVIISKK